MTVGEDPSNDHYPQGEVFDEEQQQKEEDEIGNNSTSNNDTSATINRPVLQPLHVSLDFLDDPVREWCVLVPPKLTMSALQLLNCSHCIPKHWHIEGRFGSRTHPYHERIGIPVLSRELVLTAAKSCQKLQTLLATDNVEFINKDFTPSNRATSRQVPYFDARLHPAREPTDYSLGRDQLDSTLTTICHSFLNQFTFVDLFAGIGGFAVALEALGGTCVLASEIDTKCQHVYQHNFPNCPLYGDIYQIDDSILQPLHNKVDLIVGGFPCQPFSALGDQPGLNCPKQRGHLFQEIVRLVSTLNPKAFLLENVPGLLQLTDTFHLIVKSLEMADREGGGYAVTYEICNARGLTASSRKRLFIVGIRKDLATSNSNHSAKEFQFPYVPDLQLTARDIIDYTHQELTPLERHLLPITDAQLQQLQDNKKWKPAHLAWPNTTLNTLVSHYGNSVGRGHSQLVPLSAHCNINNPRLMSPRECLRLMGFPNSYQFPTQKPNHCSKQKSNDTNTTDLMGDRAWLKSQYNMAGNAVCPPLIAAVAGAVLDQIMTDKSSVGNRVDWVERGRQIAVNLAYQATQPEPAKDGGIDAKMIQRTLGTATSSGGSSETTTTTVNQVGNKDGDILPCVNGGDATTNKRPYESL